MRTENEKMLAGELYDPLDGELVRARERARDLCQDLNATREQNQDARRRILMELFGAGGKSVWMQPPFFCDYGSNILLGERVYFNFNCVVLDVCQVKVGDTARCSDLRSRFTLPPSHERCTRARTGCDWLHPFWSLSGEPKTVKPCIPSIPCTSRISLRYSTNFLKCLGIP